MFMTSCQTMRHPGPVSQELLFLLVAATETRQPGESDRGVPAQTEASPGVRVLRSHGPQRAGPPSQRVSVDQVNRTNAPLRWLLCLG